jgi:hypothetical protein
VKATGPKVPVPYARGENDRSRRWMVSRSSEYRMIGSGHHHRRYDDYESPANCHYFLHGYVIPCHRHAFASLDRQASRYRVPMPSTRWPRNPGAFDTSGQFSAGFLKPGAALDFPFPRTPDRSPNVAYHLPYLAVRRAFLALAYIRSVFLASAAGDSGSELLGGRAQYAHG